MIALVLAAAALVVPAGEAFTCTPVRVWDADGPIWCAEGPRVRIHGIAAREMDGTCRPGHPCPDMAPAAARDALITLLRPAETGTAPTGHVVLTDAPALACRSHGGANGNRTAAACALEDGSDLACRLIAGGAVLEWLRYSKGAYRRCAR
ncbi:hypothetical protein [Sphingosinicella soli]|uniref:Endonuclease YncB(Thermonuclease family) n=1 Tax=Sphingosinicella soli TaxID=333708 RepID=A0A7W7F6P2_9SPHN|nr:hypothetical protein [Sphingosinicella soli]MBB4632541.1 endonuclease YncB(thermonuclease family) [Sphingosinicella soli]